MLNFVRPILGHKRTKDSITHRYCQFPAEGGFLKGILKLPSNSADDTDSASPESPNRVRFTLPEGHVDVPERAPIDKYNSRPGTMDAPAMSLDDIINRYSKGKLTKMLPVHTALCFNGCSHDT